MTAAGERVDDLDLPRNVPLTECNMPQASAKWASVIWRSTGYIHRFRVAEQEILSYVMGIAERTLWDTLTTCGPRD